MKPSKLRLNRLLRHRLLSVPAVLAAVALATACHRIDGLPVQAQTTNYSGYDGSALVSADGLTLTVGGYSYPCFGTITPVADESATRVSLRLRVTAPATHGVCNMAMAQVQAMDVRLRAPLGKRTLLNGATGHAVPWFDRREVLTPKTVPPGYALGAHMPAPLNVRSTSGMAVAGATQEYRSPAGGAFHIAQSVGGPVYHQGEQPPSRIVRIRGHAGSASGSAITWSENGETIDISIYNQPATGQQLTVADLIAIAESAP